MIFFGERCYSNQYDEISDDEFSDDEFSDDEFSDDGISGFANTTNFPTTKFPTTKFLTTKFPPPVCLHQGNFGDWRTFGNAQVDQTYSPYYDHSMIIL